jgi:predicted nucleic acid-binding protein
MTKTMRDFMERSPEGQVKLIDANLLIYSVGVIHPYKAPSIEVLARERRGEVEANISTEILQEVLNYYHHRRRTEFGLRLFDDLMLQFPSPYPILVGTIRTARQILEGHPVLDARDAIHAAVVFEHRLEGIISADRAFDGIAGLTRFDPKELAA